MKKIFPLLLLLFTISCTLKINVPLLSSNSYIPTLKEEKYYYTYIQLSEFSIFSNSISNCSTWGKLIKIEDNKDKYILQFKLIKKVNFKTRRYFYFTPSKRLLVYINRKDMPLSMFKMEGKIAKIYLSQLTYLRKNTYLGKLKYIRFFEIFKKENQK